MEDKEITGEEYKTLEKRNQMRHRQFRTHKEKAEAFEKRMENVKKNLMSNLNNMVYGNEMIDSSVYKHLSELVDLSKKSKEDNKSDDKETESDSFKKFADKWIEQAAKVREAQIMERNFISDEELRSELNKMNDTITNVTNHDKTNEPFGIREDKLMRRSEAKKAVSDYYDKIVDKDETNDEESNESYVKDFIKDWKDKIEEFRNEHPEISAEWCDKTEKLRLKDIKIDDGGIDVDLSEDCKIKFTFNLPDEIENCGLEYKPLEPSVFCNGVSKDETFKSNEEFNNTEQGGGNEHDDKPYWHYEPSSELVETLSDEEMDTEEPELACNNCDDEGLPVNNKYQIIYYDKMKKVFGDSGPTVYRIKALRDIGSDVKKGDLGGYIESEKNLSIDGDCWVYDNACVFEDARVLKNAKVKDESIIAGHAIITDNAITEQESCILGYTMIGGNVRTSFMFRIYSPTVFLGNSILKGHEDYLLFKPEHRIINALISYCIPSDTWTCYYRYELVVFNSTEDFISHIKENWSRFIKDEEDYLYTCIEMAKKCKELYNMNKEKQEILPYSKVILGGNNRIELDEVKFSGTVEELYKLIINKDHKFLLDSFEINYVKDQIMDVYNLVVLNTDNGETTNLHVSGKTLIHFYRYGDKLEAITAEELYLEDFGTNEIQLKTLRGFDDITIINVIKINNYYTQRMFEIRGLNLDNRLFQTFNGQEPLFTI